MWFRNQEHFCQPSVASVNEFTMNYQDSHADVPLGIDLSCNVEYLANQNASNDVVTWFSSKVAINVLSTLCIE